MAIEGNTYTSPELLPFVCVRCEIEYFATKRDAVTCPHLLCVGCYTRLLFGRLDSETMEMGDLARYIRYHADMEESNSA